MSANDGGQVVGAVFLCLRSLLSFCKHVGPSRLFWFFDTGPSPFRLTLFPDYKKKKEGMTAEEAAEEEQYREVFREQRGILTDLLPHFGVHVILGPAEADDAIAHFCRHFSTGVQMVICSDDHDFVQLVSPNVSIFSPHHVQEFTPKDILEFGKWEPHEVVLAKAILGDKSDNIPSPCKGLGPVGLRKLFNAMEKMTLSEAVEKSKGLPKKYESLADANVQADIRRNIQLIALSMPTICAEHQAWLAAHWNSRLAFNLFTVLGLVQRFGFRSLAGSLGSWSRYFERVY
jgi:5'-3' exonuclease